MIRPPDWQSPDGAIQLYHGDCLDLLPQLPPGSIDAIVTDPPYGMNNDPDSARFSGGQSPLIKRISGTPAPFPEPIVGDSEPFDPSPILALAVPTIIWGANHFAARLPVGTTLVWVKKDSHLWGRFLSDAELAWGRDGHGVHLFQRNWSGFSRLTTVGRSSHPNEKPIELMEWCLSRVSQAGGCVCDPYMGSGTTGVACVRFGRRFLGIEIERRWFDVAVRRIAKAIEDRREPLFEPPVARQLTLAEPHP